MSLRSARALLAGLPVLLFTALPAAGLEANAIADAIGAALTKGSRAQATYDAAAFDGENVVIKGFTFTGSTSADSVRFEETVVESPTEDGTGLFHSPRVTLTKGTAAGEPGGTVGSVTATDVTVLDPATVEGEGFAESVLYRTAEIHDVHALRESEPTDLAVERIAVEFGPTDGDAPRDVSGTIEGLTVSPDLFAHRRFAILARGRLRLEKLGFEKLVFDAEWTGSWDKTAGTMAISDSTFTFRDNAEVTVTGTVGSLPDPRVLNDADVVAQIAKLEFHDLVARYQEGALAGRVFDLMAEEQELSRPEYVEQLSQALPFLLANLTHAAFREKLIAALRAFIQDPLSFTIAIEPEEPISGNEIVSIAKSAPGTLPDRLKASVSANGEE
ncbi:MAG: hypothetical protein ACRED5_05275 [Propylenella sp.]